MLKVVLPWLGVIWLLYGASLYNYLLFHSLAELFSIGVAITMYILVWNTRRFMSNDFLFYISVSYLFVGFIDLLHTLTYKGMGVFAGNDANLPTQLWIAARYLQSLSLLLAPVFIKRRLNVGWLLLAFGGITIIVLGAIATGIFPNCYVNELTPFKKISEYIIALIFGSAVLWLIRKREAFKTETMTLVTLSILLTILAELMFTTYISVYGTANFWGHIFRVIATYCLYKAIIETGLNQPFEVLFRDVKKREEEREHAESQSQKETGLKETALESLRESEERYRLAIQATRDGLWEWDMRTNQIFVSPRWCEIIGFSFDDPDLPNLVKAWSSRIHPDDQDRVRDAQISHIEKGTPYDVDFRYLHTSGEYRWQNSRRQAVFDEHGNPIKIVGCISDTTERKRAEEQIIQLNAELEQRVHDRTALLEAANQELEAFSYSVSHDLRAPLRALDGFGAILLEDYADQLDEKGQHYLIRIQEAARRMGELINDLINLSRVTRSKFTRQRVDLSALALEIAVELQAQAPQRQVEFEIAADLIVAGDARLLKIALENLLSNAFKFTGQREKGRIQVGMSEQTGQRIYFVRDNGAGFDMAYANKLFAPFQRLHSLNEFSGTGIGLVTVKRIITRHGGQIWPEAGLDQGATFYFTLGDG